MLETDRDGQSNWSAQKVTMPQLLQYMARNRTVQDAEQTRVTQLHEQLRAATRLTSSARVLLELLDIARLDTHPLNSYERSAYNGEHRERVRALGLEAHALGGMQLMQECYHNVQPADRRDLEIAWHGIGNWLS